MTRHNPRAVLTPPIIVAALCAVGIALELVRIVLLLRGPEMVVAAMPPRQQVMRAARRNARLDVNAILAAKLFGEAQVAQTADAEAAITHESLVLTGVLASNAPASGLALIGASPSETRLYEVGKEVSPGLTLRSIFADHVLLDHNGVPESLYLNRKVDPLALNSATAAAAEPPVNVSNLFRPKFRGGKLVGFLPNPGADLAQLGLKPGEMIVDVNGIALDNKMTADAALQTLANAGNGNARVRALDGEERSVLISLQPGDR